MDEETLKAIAGQLRQPNGEHGKQVAEKMNEGNLQMNLNTIEALNLTAGDNVLEIGMGNGFFVKDILRVADNIKYTGCDFSSLMVDEAQNLNKGFVESEQAKFMVASAEKLPFGDETFDKVFSINTIYFWNDPRLVLAEISRVLKPTGQITISIRPKIVMEQYPFTKYGFTMLSKDDLVNLLTVNNFTITDTVEKEEPPQEINGEKLMMEMLVVSAEKIF